MVVPTFMALRAFQTASAGELESGERFTGGGHDLNYLAYMFSVAIMFSIYLATNKRPFDRRLRWLYWGFAAWCALQALLTGSRGGLLSLIVTVVFGALLGGIQVRKVMSKMVMRVAIRLVLVAVVGGFTAKAVLPAELFNRLTMKGGGGTSIEDDPRMRIWRKGMEGYWKSPIIGQGTASFFVVAADEDGSRRAPHNTFISFLVELGAVGLALYIIFLILLFREAWKLPHRERLMWIGILSITVLNAMTCGSQGDKFTWFLYAMVLAQVAALGPLAKKQRTRPLPRGVAPPYTLRPGLPRS
jgi:O-antigen ligase